MRPIKMTEKIYEEILAEFKTKMKNYRLFDGKIKYEQAYEYTEGSGAKIIFTPFAFAKMQALIQGFSTEVAWHGIAKRSPESDFEFWITDILVYPQKVTGSTVKSDVDKYGAWQRGFLESGDLETFNSIRMQGHSHVNMGVTPSGTDLNDQKEFLSGLSDEDFYIFMIYNKKGDRFAKIFDLRENVLYENKDIEVTVDGAGEDIEAFMKDAKSKVKETYNTYRYESSYRSPYQNKWASDNWNSSSKTKSDSKKGDSKTGGKKSSSAYNYDDYKDYKVYEDDDDEYGDLFDDTDTIEKAEQIVEAYGCEFEDALELLENGTLK